MSAAVSAIWSNVRSVRRRVRPHPCRWCGRDVADGELGRRRRYCRQSCRQRAYEQRASINRANDLSLPADTVVLSAREAADLADRVYQLRCAAEDIATAIDEGAGVTELRGLCTALLCAAESADGWR